MGTSWRLPVLLRRAFGLHSRLLSPPRCFRVADRVEEQAKEREAIPSPEPETGGVRRKGVRERAGVVAGGPEGIGNNLCDYTGDGKRTRRKVSGTTKAAVVDKLRDLRTQLDKGVTPKAGYAHYTVRQAAQDWLAHGLDGRSPKTIKKNQNVLQPILKVIGARKLRDLTAADVRHALAAMAAGYSTAAVSMGHLALKRAIRHAEANDLVSRNVATLADTPKGQQGRPSKSLTLDQAAAVIAAARTPARHGTAARPGRRPPAGRADARLLHRRVAHGDRPRRDPGVGQRDRGRQGPGRDGLGHDGRRQGKPGRGGAADHR